MHVGPSHPSLQTQVNDSPVTTQVPPFSHGFGRQLEFLAEKKKRRVFAMEGLSVESALVNPKQSQETAVGLAFVSVFPFFSLRVSAFHDFEAYCQCNQGF